MRRVSDDARLCRHLEETGLAELAADYPAALYYCPAGRDIARQGEPLTSLYVFLEGRAKVVRLMENGRTMLHDFYQEVALLGDLELCRGDLTARTTVRAVTDAWLIGFSLEGRREKMLGDARFLRLMCRELAGRLMAYMAKAQSGGVFSENLTATAEILGVSYRHLLRTLRDFEQEGRIRRVRGGYALPE